MRLHFERLRISDLMVIPSKKFVDERGFFIEKYKQSDFSEIGLPPFVQDNYSVSKYGVIRGLHFQAEPRGQGKLVSVVAGKVWDVAVDVRKASPTFGEWAGIELSEENNVSFYIPPGFAHGFSVLSPEARFLYKCTTEYSPAHERGVRFNDPDLHIDWQLPGAPIVSAKDLALPLLKEMQW